MNDRKMMLWKLLQNSWFFFWKKPSLFVLFGFCTFVLITLLFCNLMSFIIFIFSCSPVEKFAGNSPFSLKIHVYCLLQHDNAKFVLSLIKHTVLFYLSLHLSWKRSNLDPSGHRNVSLVIITNFDASDAWYEVLCLLQIWYNLQSDDKSL